ncbi:MAG: ABC transporter permease [Pseudomonadota bacterium]|nr:ABC transporter permease [Pseudomonadota bacterium]
MLEDDQIQETVIQPAAKWGIIDFAELNQYRDLIFFMIWRGVKVAYAQSVGGIAWAVIQPAIQIIVFSIVFGGLLSLDTEGIPYPLFTTVAVIPWSYMSSAMSTASNSLVTSSGMLGKIYFPRVIYLLAPCIGGLIPFFVSLLLIVAVVLYYQVPPTMQLIYLPLFFFLMILLPFAISLWLASLALRFRDVKIVMTYFMRMLIYTVPVMYASHTITESLRPYFILNPYVGVIEGFRSCLLGQPIYWDSAITSIVVTILLLFSGAIYFRRMERIVVDVI